VIQISSHFYQPICSSGIFICSKQVHPLWKFFSCSCLWPNRIRKNWVKTESTELWPRNHYAKKGLVQFHFELFFGCPWISNNKTPPWWWAGMICRPAFEISPKQSTNINLCCGIFQDPPTRPFTNIPVVTLNYLLKWFGNPYENMSCCMFQKWVPTLKYLPFGYHLQIWIAMNGHVYDMTKFHRIHPGGSQIILQHAGTASWW